jgi:hypothetical protein
MRGVPIQPEKTLAEARALRQRAQEALRQAAAQCDRSERLLSTSRRLNNQIRQQRGNHHIGDL